jgi:hypothetical protein
MLVHVVILSLRRHRGIRIFRRVPGVIWVLSFAVQLALLPMAILSASEATGKYMVEAALPYAWLDFSVKVTQTVLPDLLGFLFGFVLKPFPAFIREPGRWIWVVPAILFPVVMGISFSTDLHQYYLAVFGIKGAQYDGLGVIGLIFPAGGICMYSLGVRAGDRYSDPLHNVSGDEDAIPDGAPRPKPSPDTTDLEEEVPPPAAP